MPQQAHHFQLNSDDSSTAAAQNEQYGRVPPSPLRCFHLRRILLLLSFLVRLHSLHPSVPGHSVGAELTRDTQSRYISDIPLLVVEEEHVFILHTTLLQEFLEMSNFTSRINLHVARNVLQTHLLVFPDADLEESHAFLSRLDLPRT
ncbi:hypothetical protein DVH05_001352 [Phytophthora capsici]|nr:hypothetical protein DVH05_001352 [Phytophthora capsici]